MNRDCLNQKMAWQTPAGQTFLSMRRPTRRGEELHLQRDFLSVPIFLFQPAAALLDTSVNWFSILERKML